ncbi:glutamine synthetase [Seongchinamella sediminis]|uniref:Glutamine synthetase n=1 Tax=Seongchinamella sediminis TaxID=2283635 RepID=A0A3L7E1L5_9GAMM|nr:glutamine synthetase family protein [Seongchinamella sediminis]RLQ23354.1 glutamine synthetase [Seongchinamella sediminis]
MTDNKDKLQSFLDQHPQLEIFEVMLMDLCGGLRGKWVTRDKIRKVMAGRLKMPISTLAFDVWGRDAEEWVFDGGDGDGWCAPDIRTLVPTPWLERPTGQVLMSMNNVDGSPCSYDPRYLLQGLAERFARLGLTPVMASEMEFHLLHPEEDGVGRPVHTQQDRIGGVLGAGQTYGIDLMEGEAELMHDIRDACAVQGLPVDTLTKESAPSQYEINLYHVNDALLAADQAMMLQRVIRGVARKHGLVATFMAKPFGDIAGNGMHVHCSLVDSEGNNVFDDGTDKGTEMLRQAIAGCLDTMAESMLLFAPNLNSYRRFRRGTHAPLAPTWGYENRTVAVRVPTDRPAATRIEHRVAGADANPYLVMAAMLAGMLHGIENKLQAPEALEGNAYEQVPPSLPRYWPNALDCFAGSRHIPAYLGSDFQKVFTILKQQELDTFDSQVTALEYDACL